MYSGHEKEDLVSEKGTYSCIAGLQKGNIFMYSGPAKRDLFMNNGPGREKGDLFIYRESEKGELP